MCKKTTEYQIYKHQIIQMANTPLKLVMLVDDNETDNFISKRVIEVTKFAEKIIVQNSGKNALEYLGANHDIPENLPDLIFLDINMPIVDGFVFLVEFDLLPESVRKKCRIAVLSSSSNKRDITRMIDTDYVFDFITKPLNADVVKKIGEKWEEN